MGRIFSDRTARDTEFASESLIHPALTGNVQKRNGKSSSRPTLTEQQQETQQIDDFNEKKNTKKYHPGE